MQFRLQAGTLADQEVDALVIPVAKDRELTPEGAEVNRRLDGALEDALTAADFTGEVGKTVVLSTLGRLPAQWLVATGIGPGGTRSTDDIRRAWGVATRGARDTGATTIASPPPTADSLSTEAAYRAAVEGARLAAYRFLEHRTQNLPKRDIQEVIFTGSGQDAERGIKLGEKVADGVTLARNLGNQPPDIIYPQTLAEKAREVAEQNGLECRIYDRAALEELGANGIIQVGKGSAHEPVMIHLTYRPKGEARGTIGLVGKGITFDSGGLNIKPSGSMETMKIDKAGGCAVLGVMSILSALDLPFVVHGVIPSAENMVSGSSYHPSDVFRALNGKTIEVANTDAEGRLILADALTYTARQGAQVMIDLATLTGACMVALGQDAAGVFGNDDALVETIMASGKSTGELLWKLPLWKDYLELIKGDVADLKNSGGRWGGAITAALFLQEFTENVPWAHLDIAGPAWAEKETAYSVKGATGFGVNTMVRFLESWAER